MKWLGRSHFTNRHVPKPGHSPAPARVGHAAVVGFIVASLTLASCKSQSKPDSNAAPPTPAPSFATLAASHNDRVARLTQIYASGVIEIRWTDRKGKHFEQGNMELWIHQPRRTALRVEKLGEPLLWLGSNDTQYWLFDLLGDERVLHLGSHDSAHGPSSSGTGLMIDIKPLALLDLVGVTPINADEPADVNYNAQHQAWMIAISGQGGPMQMYFDRQSLLPKRIESLGEAGNIIAHATLQRYKSVTMQGVSPLAFPKLAHQIDIILPSTSSAARDQPSGAAGGEVKIVMDHSTTVINSTQLQAVFKLERLKQSLRPGRVEEM